MNNLFTSYASSILEKQNLKQEEANLVINSAVELFNLIPNIYNNLASNVGLLVGKVQSGKTLTMIASAAVAFQNGHNLVIAFLSDTDLLLDQNYERIKNAFSSLSNFISVYKEANGGDFNDLSKDDLVYSHSKNKKMFVCCLKHQKWINELVNKIKSTGYEKDCTLIFDDEGDDISQNNVTEKKKFGKNENGQIDEIKFSKTNEVIREFKKQFVRSSYVEVTATPESIVMLQNFQHLSPDFVLTFLPGIGYCGLQYFHDEFHDKLIRVIDNKPCDLNLDNGITEELKNAIAHFIAGAYYREILNESNFKHSMMIHTSKLVKNHKAIADKVNEYIYQIRDGINYNRKISQDFLLRVKNELNDFAEQKLVDSLNLNNLADVLNAVKISCINGENEIKNLKTLTSVKPYHIFIGGDLLDRGVTIDGLAVSYIIRETKTAQMDTLLQRARWFGYKQKYINTCKVYLTNTLDEQFREIADVEQKIWDMLTYCSYHKISPKDFNFEFDINSKILVPTSKAKASYETTLTGLNIEQRHVMINKTYNQENIELIESWKQSHINDLIDKRYGSVVHKLVTVHLSDIKELFQKFHFSNEDNFWNNISFNQVLNSLNYHDNDLVDVLFMYRNGKDYEERSLVEPTSNVISGLLQGHSVNKLPTDADYYKGDRYIVENRPILQIHKVVLKNDMQNMGDNNFQKGDKTIMLAWLFPDTEFKNMIIRKKDIIL